MGSPNEHPPSTNADLAPLAAESKHFQSPVAEQQSAAIGCHRVPRVLQLDIVPYLPMSLRESFLLNFISSICSFSTLLYAPPMAGLSLAMAIRYGGGFWGGILLVPCFVLMLNAIAFQFRAWLAFALRNHRRRQWVATAICVVVARLAMLQA